MCKDKAAAEVRGVLQGLIPSQKSSRFDNAVASNPRSSRFVGHALLSTGAEEGANSQQVWLHLSLGRNQKPKPIAALICVRVDMKQQQQQQQQQQQTTHECCSQPARLMVMIIRHLSHWECFRQAIRNLLAGSSLTWSL